MNEITPVEQLLRWRLAAAETEAPPAPTGARLLKLARPWWESWPERFQMLLQRVGRIQITYGHAMTVPGGAPGGYPVPALIVRPAEEVETSVRVLYLAVRDGWLWLRFQLSGMPGPAPERFSVTFVAGQPAQPLLSTLATLSVDNEYRIDAELGEPLARGLGVVEGDGSDALSFDPPGRRGRPSRFDLTAQIPMSGLWFWKFWHWSEEGFRDGSMLRSPLQGIGGHWDEWFRHEASPEDRQAVERTGREAASQRQFIAWLWRRWAPGASLRRNRLARHFVLGQLAHVEPFSRWAAFANYRPSYGVGGIPAIVLAEGSSGDPEDIRRVEALTLPADPTGPAVVAEGFQADSPELETPRRAVLSLLRGKAFLSFLGWWLVCGRRPYPQWLKIGLGLGWLAVAGLILDLLAGPEPGERLRLVSTALVALWTGLVLIATTAVATQGLCALHAARGWYAQLEQSQVRLRMNGGLTLKGGSAGLAFCLNTLLALYRADPRSARGSWLWRRVFQKLRSTRGTWAATGVITGDGQLKPVVLDPKIRACLQRNGIRHLLVPRQVGASPGAVHRLAGTPSPARAGPASTLPARRGTRLGFAAEASGLQLVPCRHAAQALMLLGGLISKPQIVLNGLALVASLAVVLSVSDLRGILRPPPAPLAVAPSSPSPECLWVSLETKQPAAFFVTLESRYWSNRRAAVAPHTGFDGSIRAEIRLRRLRAPSANDEENGTVWVERRHRFLTRAFAPGERVGRYTLSYLKRLGHE